MNIFEQASRLGIRFDSSKGPLTAEDLWQLPLTSETGKANLDDIARGLHRKLQSADDVSFVAPEKKGDETIQLRFDIVKHIIDVRVSERNALALARANKEKKQKLLEILDRKENAALENLDPAELRKMVEAL